MYELFFCHARCIQRAAVAVKQSSLTTKLRIPDCELLVEIAKRRYRSDLDAAARSLRTQRQKCFGGLRM